MAEAPVKKKTLRDLLRLVFRRRWLFIVASALFAFIVLVAAHTLPERYTSRAVFERRMDEVIAHKQGYDKGIETVKIMLRYELSGDHAVDRAIEELGMTEGFKRGSDGEYTDESKMLKQELIARIRRSIRVGWSVQSKQIDMIGVTYTDRDADMAFKLPNKLVKNYINRISRQIQDRLYSAQRWLKPRVEAAKRDLREKTNTRIDFEDKYDGMIPDRIGTFNAQILKCESDLQTVLFQADKARQNGARLLAMLNPTTQPTKENFVENPKREEIQKRIEQLLELRRQWKEETPGRMKDTHPEMIKLAKLIEKTKKQLDEEPQLVPMTPEEATASGKDAIKVNLAAVAAQIESLEREKERLEKFRDKLMAIKANFAQVKREWERIVAEEAEARSTLSGLARELKNTDANLQQEVAKKRMHWNQVQLAKKQYRPSSPKPGKILMFAIMGGLAFGGGLMFLFHFLDRSVSTRDVALTHFDIPVHGVIGEIDTATTRRNRRLRRWIVTPLISLILVACLGLSSMSLWMWLRSPEKYKAWRASPTGFLYDQVVTPIEDLLDSV